ncbi:MAG: DUF4249 domain-containing protein [Bacteroidota bacterium]
MKSIINFFAIGALAILIVSCQQIVELEIEDSEKKVVIAAELQAGTHPFEVLISRSSLYYESDTNVFVENAIVILSDDFGLSQLIPHTADGLYSANVVGEAGNTYTLSVEVDDLSYTAQSTMPYVIPLINLTTRSSSQPPNQVGTRVSYSFKDSVGIMNYYRVRHSVDGELQSTEPRFFNDGLQDGQLITRSIRRGVYQTGQEITVELIHMNESNYDYLYTLDEIIGENRFSNSTSPANPITNWSNGALGVFNTYNIDTMTVVIP